MKKYFVEKNILPCVEFFVTLVLFVLIKNFYEVNSFARLVVALLEFIIILELVRMLIEFLFSDENRIRIRLMIDSTIVFFIRDVMLIANDTFDSKKIFIVLAVIGILLIFRIVTIRFSPSVVAVKNNKEVK